jgi:uncharacterized protein (DUF58 family)
VTRRGRSVLTLGLVVYLAAWAFGSRPLYPVAAGLLLASALAWTWVRAADRPMRVERRAPKREHVEGDDVEQRVIVRPTSWLPPPTAALVEAVGRLGEQRHVLGRQGRRLFVDYRLRRLPRGRYAFSDSRIEIADPFGLQRRAVPLPQPGALLVYPRVVHLDRLFSESGAHALEGRRLLLRRPTGFDLHSVRDYEHGESLRKVHWRSTARRGQLMVKELEDAPRDEIAVLLDAQRGAVAGESFDVQVRAAASILDAYVRRNRRAVLVVNSAVRATQQVHSPAGDRGRALELLAAVEPTATTPVTTLLAEDASPAARALELVVVTARIDSSLVDRLVQRALARRRVSLVYVDAATFAGSPPTVEPLLLRLSGSGVPVAVVRAGDDLAAVLAGDIRGEAAGAAHA